MDPAWAQTHLYAGATWRPGNLAIAETACGLRKSYVWGRLPASVTESAGRVTCPDCLRKLREREEKARKTLSPRDFCAQEGKKAQ